MGITEDVIAQNTLLIRGLNKRLPYEELEKELTMIFRELLSEEGII